MKKVSLMLSLTIVLSIMICSTAIAADYSFLEDMSLEELLDLQAYISEQIAYKSTQQTDEDRFFGLLLSDKAEILAAGAEIDYDTPYEKSYAVYHSIELYPDYQKDSELNTLRHNLMDKLICNLWNNDDGYEIKMVSYYSDYNNTKTSNIFSNNLPNTKIKGQSYYYFSSSTDEGYIIGYESKMTGDKENNYLINFFEDHIQLYSYVEKKTYKLMRDTTYTPPASKGNAKNAFIYIGSVLGDYYNPSSITINWCYFDSENQKCYYNATANNRAGGSTKNTYVIWYSPTYGYTYIEVDTTYVSNVDCNELTDKLREYARKMY